MKNLLVMDSKDYTDDMPVFEKYSVRALICRDGKYAMQMSGAGEYKIPGGCVESGEDFIVALKREVQEETGLILIPASVREIGEITEMRRDVFDASTKYICHSLFYFCDVTDEVTDTCMTESEIAKGFHPAWADLDTIISTNRRLLTEVWTLRDTVFLEMLRDQIIK